MTNLNKIALIAVLGLASTSALAIQCAPALGMVETAQTTTGNDGTAWIRTPVGTYTGRLVGTVEAVNPLGLPSRISYVFTSLNGTVQLTGTPNYTRYADMDADRYVLDVALSITRGKLDNLPVRGAFTVALAANTGLNDERGTVASGLICH